MAQQLAEFEALAGQSLEVNNRHIEALRTLVEQNEDSDVLTEANDVFEETYREMGELQRKMSETGIIDIY